MIKAVFFDIDGTIFDGPNGVPDSTIKSLDLLKQKSIKRVIATGRDLNEVLPTGLTDYNFDAYITLNGELCFDEKLKVFYGHPISKNDKEVLIDEFNKHKYPMGLCLEKGTILNYVDDNVRKIHDDLNCSIPHTGKYNGEDFYQAIAYLDSKGQEELASKLNDCYLTSWNSAAVDVVDKNGGKEKGIESYINLLGIKKEETMAFGDGHNDITMIKYAGIGVAMGNSIDSLKEVSDYITDDIKKDGVYKALKNFKVI